MIEIAIILVASGQGFCAGSVLDLGSMARLIRSLVETVPSAEVTRFESPRHRLPSNGSVHLCQSQVHVPPVCR